MEYVEKLLVGYLLRSRKTLQGKMREANASELYMLKEKYDTFTDYLERLTRHRYEGLGDGTTLKCLELSDGVLIYPDDHLLVRSDISPEDSTHAYIVSIMQYPFSHNIDDDIPPLIVLGDKRPEELDSTEKELIFISCEHSFPTFKVAQKYRYMPGYDDFIELEQNELCAPSIRDVPFVDNPDDEQVSNPVYILRQNK